MLKLTVLIVMITIAVSLHLPTHSKYHVDNNHELTDRAIAHLGQLSANQIQTRLDLLSNQIAFLQLSYQQLDYLDQVETIGNEGAIIKCKNISSTDQISLKYTSENIQNDIWEVYFQIQQFTKKNGQNDTLAQQFQQLKQRQQKLQNKSFTYCPQSQNLTSKTIYTQENSFSDISQNAFISNLDANSNWVYGKLSPQQYQLNQFQFLLANDVIKCPNDTPFASKGKCITCQKDSVFFLDTGNCAACPSGTVFNNQSHLCQTSASNNCIGNQKFNAQTKKCECPQGSPYFSGTQCVSCFIPKYWNQESKKCQSCPKGNYYSIQKGGCVQCTDQENYISSLSSCHDECTLSKPYYDGGICINCPEIFNANSKKCQKCSNELYFNKEKGICSPKDRNPYPVINCSKGYVFNAQNGQCVKSSQCSCPANYVYNITTLKCQCPKSQPYDTGVKCINCSGSSTWDPIQKKCTEISFIEPVAVPKVPVVEVKNQTVTKPVIVPTPAPKPVVTVQNKTSNTTITQPTPAVKQPVVKVQNKTINVTQTVIIGNCASNETWDNKTKTCICSPNTPYRTLSGACIQCLRPNLWSESLRQCLPPAPTCKSNFIYDQSTQTCVCPRDKPFDNGQECQSCYLPMYWNNIERSCKYCPSNQYFNPLTRKCQQCPESRPLLVNYVCQACQKGTRYNKVNNRCETIICYDLSIYSDQKNDCQCPDRSKPFYNGQLCVSCMSPNRWDLASRSCVNDSGISPNYNGRMMA